MGLLQFSARSWATFYCVWCHHLQAKCGYNVHSCADVGEFRELKGVLSLGIHTTTSQYVHNRAIVRGNSCPPRLCQRFMSPWRIDSTTLPLPLHALGIRLILSTFTFQFLAVFAKLLWKADISFFRSVQPFIHLHEEHDSYWTDCDKILHSEFLQKTVERRPFCLKLNKKLH